MDAVTVVALVCAGIALVLTPVYLWLLAKGVKSLSDIRDVFRRPVGDRGHLHGHQETQTLSTRPKR